MIRGGYKSIGFLGVTGAALLWELVASFDSSESTVPWTDLIVEYIPGEVTTAVIGALVCWLPVHFGLRYYRSKRRSPE
jgi:hypothetical protein